MALYYLNAQRSHVNFPTFLVWETDLHFYSKFVLLFKTIALFCAREHPPFLFSKNHDSILILLPHNKVPQKLGI